METKILGIYEISYANGIKQRKNLIGHNDYLEIIVVTLKEIDDLERKNKFKETKESAELKRNLKIMFGSEWFTNKSPFYDAITTGLLILPPTQGGIHECFLKKIA